MSRRPFIGIAVAILVLALPRVSSAAPTQLRPVAGGASDERTVGGPVSVNVLALPRVDQDPSSTNRLLRVGYGPRPATPFSDRDAQAMRESALARPPQPGVQIVTEGQSPYAPALDTSFDSLNFDDDPTGVPPDADLAVGPNHIMAVVNASFEIYDKSGTTLVGPTRLDTFFAPLGSLCSGGFDPNVAYDEKANRFVIGESQLGTGPNGANNYYCMAVSKNANPAGNWWLYFFDASPNTNEFLDDPYLGVGDEAFFMGGNIYAGTPRAFVRSEVWAVDKGNMYQGLAIADPIRHSFPASAFSPHPMRAHGFAQGNWPTGIGHYVIIDSASDGSSIGVYRWTDPFGADTFTSLGSVNLDAATGVTGGLPVDSPQSGSAEKLQANDWRPLDLEYRNGHLFTAQTISCNPGGGTVNCVRWAEIDPTVNGGPAVVQGSAFASSGNYRSFPDLAVNYCNDVAIGYSKFSSNIFPSAYVVGRLGTDTLNTLQSELELKAGEVAYSSSVSDPAPHRWGDYTGMTVDPDGKKFWYLGEYSRDNTGVSKWGTRVGSFTTDCIAPADAVTLTQPVPPDMLQFCGPVSLTGTGISPGSVLKTYLSTSEGPVDMVADGISPSSTTSTTWTGTLPCPWPVNDFTLGQGFLGLQLVRTDTGFTASNGVGIPLIGNTAQSVPSILAIGGEAISTTSWQTSIGLANVESVLVNDDATVYRIDGTGFASARVNVFTASGNCGPLVPTAQTSTTVDFKIPGACPTGPGSFQVVNATGNFRSSNAVSAPIGAPVGIASVQVDGDTITVNGSGFSTLTVINFFASNGSTVENFGGLSGGSANIALSFVSSHEFSFTRPAGAIAGKAFVEAINPPFIPFSSSGNDPQGSLTLP